MNDVSPKALSYQGKRKELVISVDEGSGAFFLVPITVIVWLGVSEFVLVLTSIPRSTLFQSDQILVASAFAGFLIHELCQFVLNIIFGGRPRFSGRRAGERSYIAKKYFPRVTLRIWSPGKEFSLFQYGLILLSPTLLTYLCLPITMLIWPQATIFSSLWMVGMFMAILLPLDLSAAQIIFQTAKPNQMVMDTEEGTYLIRPKEEPRTHAG